ncbi:hypothetical protein B0G93_11550 [Bacillus sp. V-88]|nr:hypothetical protein B0G93_11550 [Bacillus sp. V-88]SLK23719.1 hypothetical protein SAMN06295884_11550 [Bacillus sp. V-88]
MVKKLFSLRIAILDNQADLAKQLYLEIEDLSCYNDNFSNDFYYRFCGLYNYLYGDLELSLNYYKIAEKLSIREDIEEVYYQIGLIYTRLENISLSTYYTAKALTRYEINMNYKICKNCNLTLAVNYRKMGENEKALRKYRAILNGLSGTADNRLRAKVYHNIGFIHFQTGSMVKAVEFLNKSIFYKGDSSDSSNTYYLLAKSFLELNKIDAVMENIKKGKKYSNNNNNRDYIIKFQILEHLVEDGAQSPIFEKYMQNIALPYFRKIKDRTTVLEFTKLLAEHYEKNNKYKSAYLLLKKLL